MYIAIIIALDGLSKSLYIHKNNDLLYALCRVVRTNNFAQNFFITMKQLKFFDENSKLQRNADFHT